MKRSHYHRRRIRSRREPRIGAWLLLLAAWAVVLPLAAWMGHVLLAEHPMPKETKEAFAAAPQKTPQEQIVSAQEQRIPSLRTLHGKSPAVLIYHTHTTEAYTKTAENPYKESGQWRTEDNTKNVVAVGEALKEILETQYGIRVLHDTTDHEPPKLASAYERSLLTMRRYKQEYPSIVLFLDLHRDAYNAEQAPTDYLIINGKETAKLMFVVGKGEQYEEKPYFDSDFALASLISDHLNTIDPKLCRPIRVKTGRYNQHVAPNCLLVEVGHNANTLEQALAAMPYLAESIAYAFAAMPEAQGVFVPN